VVGFYGQALFNFTTASTGGLFVTFAGLLSGWSLGRQAPVALGRPGSRLALIGAAAAALAAFAGNALVDGAPVGRTALACAGLGIVLAAAVAAVLGLGAGAADRELRPDASPWGGRLAWQGTVAVVAAALLVKLALLPAWANLECGRGAALLDAQPAAAVTRLEHAAALDPDREIYLVKLGGALRASALGASDPAQRCRLLRRACAALERAVVMAPANAAYRANLGRLLAGLAAERLAAPADAFAQFDAALALDPTNASYYVDAATLAVSLGDLGRARAYGERGLAIYPGLGALLAQRGYVALAEGRSEEALRALERAFDPAVARWFSDREHYWLAMSIRAQVLLRLGRAEEARCCAESAVRELPAAADARFTLAAALEQLGRLDEARAVYRDVLHLRPDHGPARQALRRISGQ
jgi:tetratricopeptide (TPR) repeat protein